MFSTDTIVNDFKQKLTRETEKTREALLTLKTGKASPAMVEGLLVMAYDTTTSYKLMELATITTNSPSQLLISPFDPSTIGPIEKAILASPLHLTPRVDSHKIYISVPPLTEEQRIALLKTVSAKIEEGKVAARNHRDDIRKKVRAALDDKSITEDAKFRLEKEIDKITQDTMMIFDEMKGKKEKEMLTI